MAEVRLIDVDYLINHLPKNYFLNQFKGLISRKVDEDLLEEYLMHADDIDRWPRFRPGFFFGYNYYIEKTELQWIENLIDQGLYRAEGSKYTIHDIESIKDRYGKGFRVGYFKLEDKLALESKKEDKEEIVISEISVGFHYRIPSENEDGKVVFSEELLEHYESQGYRYGLKYRAWLYIQDNLKSFKKYDESNNLNSIRWKWIPTLNRGERPHDEIDNFSKESNTTYDVEVARLSKILFREGKDEDFGDLMHDLGAVDDNAKPVKGRFQTRAHALFVVDKSYSQSIFKSDSKRTDFIKYLNLRFEASIKSKNNLSPFTNDVRKEVKYALS